MIRNQSLFSLFWQQEEYLLCYETILEFLKQKEEDDKTEDEGDIGEEVDSGTQTVSETDIETKTARVYQNQAFVYDD